MALNAKKVQGAGGPKAPALEPENYMARLVQVIDLGVQNQRPFQGREKPPAQEIMLTYELAGEFMPDDDGNPDEQRPRWISERMPLHNLRADKAKSTKRYMALDPKLSYGGDFSQLLGKACLVAIVNNEKDGRVYNNIGGVTQPLKGVPVPDLVNDPVAFDFDEPDLDVFLSMPDWIQGIIKDALNYKGSKLQAAVEGTPVEEPEPEADDEDFPV